MSSHLRHCPKHRKPLPCAHCALAKPAPKVEGLARPPLPPLLDTEELRKKEAERGRERRRKKSEQLAAIKLALKTPIAEIKETERRQRVLDRMRKKMTSNSSMSRGKFMTDAPSGKGELVSGGHNSEQMDIIAAAAMGSEMLGAPAYDDETGETFWPTNDRRHIEPEGAGANDEDESAHFTVKPGIDLDWGQALQNLFHEIFIEIDPEENKHDGYFVCRLCRADSPSERTCKQHLETVHGNNDPQHDSRFGNVVAKEVRKIRKRRTTGRRKLLKTQEVAA